MTALEILDRIHRADVANRPRRRRIDFIRPQETTRMPDDYLKPHDDLIRIDLVRHGLRWTARRIAADPFPASIGSQVDDAFVADGPAAALEGLGQELDQREAQRLSREVLGDIAAGLTDAEADR